ncbi:unnamed protein product [Ambrosiozyma monospora]|uniref:Unnamed protein product n=1 Tax=Ambrosiozyma monospora TaxID=43982 RepID=A0A9W6Z3L0_AMBMO|nr:unnamed protein product [Ambrosiozyma monospora]
MAIAYHPKAWKSTNTIALPKPGKSGEQAGGYRPISLINICSKILEKVVYNRMNYYVEKKHILPDNQYAGRSGSSTVDLLLKMVHDIKISNGNASASALMIDIKGAYDNVNVEKLVAIMRDLRFPKAMISWTSHFTTERTTRLITHNIPTNKVNDLRVAPSQVYYI